MAANPKITDTEPTPELSAPTSTPHSSSQDGDSLEDFFNEITSDRKFSADTVIPETGPSALGENPDVSFDSLPGGSGKEPLSDSEAIQNTEMLMNMRETAQSLGLAWYVDGSIQHYEQYLYQKAQKDRLIKSWSRIIGQHRVVVSPWVDVLFTEAICTGPMLALAFNNRKMRIDLEEKAATISRLQKENEEFRRPGAPEARKDTKTHWSVDNAGFFKYSLGNQYLKPQERREKPSLTPQNYKKLCAHNGKDLIDKVFKIEAQNG